MSNTFLDLLTNSTSTIHFDDGTALSANELALRGDGLAGSLARLVEPGGRIAIWLPSGRLYLELIVACAAGGYVAVNVNTRYCASEALDLTERSGASVLVTDQSVKTDSSVTVLAPPDIASLAPAPNTHSATAAARFLVFTTSGTTSKPKMVLHNQSSIVHHARTVPSLFGLGPSTPVLVALPLCGVFGLNSLTAAVAANCEIWLASSFDADLASEVVERHEIVAMNGSDDMFHRMLNTSYDLSSLTIAGFGAFNASLDGVAERAETRGVKLSGLYGMSEIQALWAFRDQSLPVSGRQHAGGQPASADYRVRVVNPDNGEPVDHGSEGELQIKGPSLFAGYLNEGGNAINEDLILSAFTDGWFHTGDLSVTSADGSFRFIARMGDTLRVGGFLVAPAEIEEVLLTFAGIEDAQVVAASGENGVRPVAFVIASNELDEQAVIGHCRERLAKFKCPVRVLTVTQFPVTDGPNGVKIQKSRLREMACVAVEGTGER